MSSAAVVPAAASQSASPGRSAEATSQQATEDSSVQGAMIAAAPAVRARCYRRAVQPIAYSSWVWATRTRMSMRRESAAIAMPATTATAESANRDSSTRSVAAPASRLWPDWSRSSRPRRRRPL